MKSAKSHRLPSHSDVQAGFIPLNAETGNEINLGMQEIFLTGRIMATGARLIMRHTFVSSETKPAEIVYAFVLPRDAALRRFKIAGTGFTASSELKETEAARKIYEDGIEEGHLSTLAQQYRDGYINLNVGNVRPGEKITVHLELVAGVDLRDDGLRFRFPFTLAPCYHSKMKAVQVDDNSAEIELPEKEFGDLILPPFAKDAAALHQVGFDLSVQMPGAVAEAGSPSHAINVKTMNPQRIAIRLAPGYDIPNRDLVLDIRMKSSFSGILCGTDRKGRAQLAAVVASDRFGEAGKDLRRMVFLFDRSSSMEGEPIRQARNAVLACLGALSAADQIGFVAFDSSIEVFKDALAETNTQTREALREFIEKVDARGGTELFQGLKAASELLGRTGGDIFLLTDGQVSATETIIQQTKALGIRIHCLGIGSASQDRFLNQISRETGGISRFVTPRERVDKAALELFAAIGRPVATDIKVQLQGLGDATLSPEPATTVFSGHPLVVYGESAQGNGQLVIEWAHEDKSESIVLPVNASDSADAETLKLLRGARLITDLESRLGADTERDAAERRESKRVARLLAELGQTYGLANRQLSLVAVVERAGDKAGQLPATSIVPVGMPQDTGFDSYFGRDKVLRYASISRPSSGICCDCASSYDADVKDEILFSLQPRKRKSDTTDLCMELAKRIQPDGGLPGKTDEERICHSLVALLALLESDMAKAFRPHIDRLADFLESGVCSALGEEHIEVTSKILGYACAHRPIAGQWIRIAETLILKGGGKLETIWQELDQVMLCKP